MSRIYVFLALEDSDVLLGSLYTDVVRGKENYSFEFDRKALANGQASLLFDEDLFPILGRQYKQNPSIPYHFMEDSSPDRWGRKLLQKASFGKALMESDYLLGVSDASRMGAIRYASEPEGPFLAISKEIPPLKYLRELEEAAYSFDQFSDDPRWQTLLAPGSSMGGARPKATIYDTDGSLYLAKFSNRNDDYDIPAVEYWTYLLAEKAGVEMMPSKLLHLDNKRSVFLTKRFDREAGERIHYVSFMTLLNAEEGDSSSYSYLDVAEVVSRMSHFPNEDLEQLFRRIAFSIFVHNYDDHLRNHAMIYRAGRWRLSPAFDLNISLDKGALTLPVSKEGNDLATLISASPYFGLEVSKGAAIVSGMKQDLQETFEALGKKANLQDSFIKGVRKRLIELD